mgnify:CR=1 FL=1
MPAVAYILSRGVTAGRLLTWRDLAKRPLVRKGEMVEALRGEAEALAGSGFTMGHLAIGTALAYLDFRFADLRWRDGHPRLAAWHETFNARPSVIANAVVDDR